MLVLILSLFELVHTYCASFFVLLISSTTFIYKLRTKYSAVDSFCLQGVVNVDKCRNPLAILVFIWYYIYVLTCEKVQSKHLLSTDCG